VDAVEVSTVVYLPPGEVYDFLIDFPRYARYSKHLREVRQHGDGAPGTEYDLVFEWWKLTDAVRSRVTGVDRPTRIDWAVVKAIDARGYWSVEHVPREAESAGAPAEATDACRVRLRVEFRPGSADSSAISLPAFVSLDWVIEKVKPMIEEEATRVVRRIVADLEGRRRDVDLEIHAVPSSV
jgi:hypothetical protein